MILFTSVVIAVPAWHHRHMAWFTQTREGVSLSVHAIPRAARSEFAGLHGENALRVRLRAPPVDGKANAALATFLAEAFGLPKRDVILMQGATGRHKRVLLRGLAAEAVHRVLGIS